MKQTLTGSKMPAYVAVYNSLYSDLRSGVYRENEALPGETALAEKYHVSRNTLRQALAILAEDGLIVRSQGRETLVAPQKKPLAPDKHKNPLIDLARQKVDQIQIQYNYNAPTDIARAKLSLDKTDIVLACDIVYRSAGQAIGYAFTQIPVAVFKELNVDLSQEGAIERLSTQSIFEAAQQWDLVIKLIFANEMEKTFLEIEEGRPMILMEVILRDEESRPLARNKLYFLPEHYLLQFHL